MICQDCGKREGSTRCEGCQKLFCMPCANKHHDSRMQQFQAVTDLRNQLKEKLNTLNETNKEDLSQHPAVLAIKRWEKKSIERIRTIAKKLKGDVTVTMSENVRVMDERLEQISTTIQHEQKKETFLEPATEAINQQLADLCRQIDMLQETIRVHTEKSDSFNWESLISITMKSVPVSSKTIYLRPDGSNPLQSSGETANEYPAKQRSGTDNSGRSIIVQSR